MSSLYDWSVKLLNSKKDKIKAHADRYHNISFVVLGDSHLTSTGKDTENHFSLNSNGEKYKQILTHIINNKDINPFFIIHGGDAVDSGENNINFKAFVNTTKKILHKKKLPMFVSIGNHDYNLKNKSSDNFKHFIGPTCKCIHIPYLPIKLVLLNIYYSKTEKNNDKTYFSDKAWNLLENESSILHNTSHYIIDFHSPLRVFSSKKTSCSRGLSKNQTDKFFGNIAKLNVCGIFCHHRHTSCTTYIQKDSISNKISYTISGCGGNHRKNKNFSYYYVTLDTNNYNMTCKEILVL